MKKILLLMLLVCVIIVGVVNYDGGVVSTIFGTDTDYVVTTVNKPVKGAVCEPCGDYYINYVKGLTSVNDYLSISVESSDYSALSKFINDYQLSVVNSYWVEDTLVRCYYSPWFSKDVGGMNFQLADYGNYYKLGYPIIMEGF